MKLLTQNVCAWTASVTFCAFSGTVLAVNRVDTSTQQMRRVDLRNQLQTPAVDAIPSLSRDELADVGPQFVVREKPKKTLFEAAVDVQYGQSSNVYLAENAAVRAPLAITTAQVAVAPEPVKFASGELGVKAGYRHQKFNYGKFSQREKALNDMDFDVSSFFAQGRYLHGENLVFSAGLEHNRLLNAAAGGYDEFFSEVVPSVGVDGQYKLGEKSSVGLSMQGLMHFTRVDPPNPNQNDRIEEVLTASYTRELTPNLSVQPFYRAQLSQYNRNRQRNDVVQTLGVSFGYAINRWAAVRFFASYETRESSEAFITDYRKFDNGIGVSFQARF
jgi:hypothetical protein